MKKSKNGKETIIGITEGDMSNRMAGYVIETNKQKITVAISNKQSCCESWGYLTTNDDLNDFIDAELFNVRITDPDLKSFEVCEKEIYVGEAIFVTFETSSGDFQLVVYNSHNGYYSHRVEITSSFAEANLETHL